MEIPIWNQRNTHMFFGTSAYFETSIDSHCFRARAGPCQCHSMTLAVAPFYTMEYVYTIIWLVVGPPLWKIWKSIGMMKFPIYGKKENVPNHHPVIYTWLFPIPAQCTWYTMTWHLYFPEPTRPTRPSHVQGPRPVPALSRRWRASPAVECSNFDVAQSGRSLYLESQWRVSIDLGVPPVIHFFDGMWNRQKGHQKNWDIKSSSNKKNPTKTYWNVQKGDNIFGDV